MKCTKCDREMTNVEVHQANGISRRFVGCPHHWRSGEVDPNTSAEPIKARPAPAPPAEPAAETETPKPATAKSAKSGK